MYFVHYRHIFRNLFCIFLSHHGRNWLCISIYILTLTCLIPYCSGAFRILLKIWLAQDNTNSVHIYMYIFRRKETESLRTILFTIFRFLENEQDIFENSEISILKTNVTIFEYVFIGKIRHFPEHFNFCKNIGVTKHHKFFHSFVGEERGCLDNLFFNYWLIEISDKFNDWTQYYMYSII